MQINAGIITVSDRASKGLYDDLGGPALKKAAEGYGWKVLTDALVPDEKRDIQRAIREQINKGCQLILTTGGTGVALFIGAMVILNESKREVVNSVSRICKSCLRPRRRLM